MQWRQQKLIVCLFKNFFELLYGRWYFFTLTLFYLFTVDCFQYFNGMDISPAERDRRMRAVCRHKAKYAPPDTPEHYWSVGFPDTQECKDRGNQLLQSLLVCGLITLNS